MAISFKTINVGSEWDRPTLAELWGYQSFHALAKGVFTPRNGNKIIFFITKQKQDSATPYNDRLDGRTLKIEGENDHRTDDRIISSRDSGDELHLFYRERHHSQFTYQGRLRLKQHRLRTNKPSEFEFEVID